MKKITRILSCLICLAALLAAGSAAFAAGDAIESVHVNAIVHGDGQKIDNIVITVKDAAVLSGLSADNFKFTGNTYNWASNFVTAGGQADPMDYRTTELVAFDLEVTAAAVDAAAKTVTLSLAPHTPAGGNYKLYYVKNYTVACSNDALTFTNNQTPTDSASFANDFVSGVTTLLADDFQYVRNPKSGDEAADFNYFLYTPESAGSGPLPLVLSNHGSGDHMSTVANRVTTVFASAGVQESNPCYVLAPVYPQGDFRPFQDVIIQKTVALIKQMIADGKVDPNRIYAEGKSMGGGNTIKIVYLYPELFAAGMPLCGGNTAGDFAVVAETIKDIPMWFIVGEKDGGVVNSQGYYDAITAAGGYKAKLKIYAPEELFARGFYKAHDNEILSLEDPRYFEWLFAQVKGGVSDTIDYIRVNTSTPPRGHTIDTIDVYVKDGASIQGLSAEDFGKLTGNTYNWASSIFEGEYRSDTTVPFEANVTGVEVQGNKLSLSISPIKGYTVPADPASGVDETFNAFKKYFYVKDLTVTCQANPALSFTSDRLAVNDTTAVLADEFTVVSSKHGVNFDYHLYAPKGTIPDYVDNDLAANKITPMPLVLVMHGSGDQGSLYANRIAPAFAEPANQAERPCYILAPIYTKQQAGEGKTDVQNQWETTEHAVALIKKMIDDGLVDPARVYLIGKSMGGKNVQRTYVKYPEFFAACVSLSGSIAQEYVMGENDYTVTPDRIAEAFVTVLKDKPLYIIHANGDPLTGNDNGKTLQSRALRDALLARGANQLMFKEYTTEELVSEGMAVKPHDVEILCMEDTQFMEWMFSQSN